MQLQKPNTSGSPRSALLTRTSKALQRSDEFATVAHGEPGDGGRCARANQSQRPAPRESDSSPRARGRRAGRSHSFPPVLFSRPDANQRESGRALLRFDRSRLAPSPRQRTCADDARLADPVIPHLNPAASHLPPITSRFVDGELKPRRKSLEISSQTHQTRRVRARAGGVSIGW